jgi:hypothetical protein
VPGGPSSHDPYGDVPAGPEEPSAAQPYDDAYDGSDGGSYDTSSTDAPTYD